MPRSTVPRTAALGVAALLLLAACGGAPAGTTDATTSPPDATESPGTPASESPTAEPAETDSAAGAEVMLSASSFSPGQLTVAAGTQVTFVNNSGLPHTVTHGTGGRPADDAAFDRPVGDGASVQITFDEPGTYDITCKIHPEMQMTVVVEG
jgi:plastocyanin